MCDIIGVKDNKFQWIEEPYPIPVLNFYTDSSWNHLNDWFQYEENYRLLEEEEATEFHIYLKGAGHFTYVI